MSGVIDEKGQQWEHCNHCARFVRFPQNLGYEKPSDLHRHGRDLCVTCADHLIRAYYVKFNDIVPAPAWVTVEVEL